MFFARKINQPEIQLPMALGLLFLLLCFAPPLYAQTDTGFENVTLIKIDGWTYKNVTVTPTSDGIGISMERSDGAVLELGVNEIARILDNQGNDIISLVFPGVLRMPDISKPTTPASIARPTYDEFGNSGVPNVTTGDWVLKEQAPPRMFDVMVVGGGGYSSPKGAFYDGMDSGLLYFGEVCLSFAPRKYIRLSYRSMRALDESLYYYDYGTQSGIDMDRKLDIRQYSVTAGTLSYPNGRNKIRAYGEVGVSFVDHVLEVIEYETHVRTASELRVLVLFRAGALIPVKNGVGLDLGVSLGIKTFGGNYNEGVGFLFDFHAGLMIPFGGDDR